MSELDYKSYNSSLFCYNFPKSRLSKGMIPSESNTHIHDMLEDLKNNGKLLLKENEALYIYCSNSRINELESINHTQSTVDFLNNNGLRIYLMEPISYYILNDDNPNAKQNLHNMGFYSEFPNYAIGKNFIRCGELDSILLYVERNNLTNVEVRTCDYNVEHFLKFYKDKIKLLCDDIFLASLKFYDNVDTNIKDTIEKKFISVNWRYSPHRAIVCATLIKEFQDHSFMTWYFNLGKNVFYQSSWAAEADASKYDDEFYKYYIDGVNKLNKKSPLCLDIVSCKPVDVNNNLGNYYPNFTYTQLDEGMNPTIINETQQPLQYYYNRSFVSIVNESRYAQPTANFSEKVIQPIIYKTPFVLVAPPQTLEYVKSYGFKTFDKWWNEDYDFETNHLKRMKKIIDIIRYIGQLTYEELYSMYLDMLPVLEHNLNNFIKISGGSASPINHRSKEDIAWMPKR